MKRKFLFALAALGACLLLAGCGSKTNSAASGGDACMPALTQDDLLEQSTLIVRGTVTEQSAPFDIAPTNGGDASSFIDHTVSVTETLYGEAGAPSVVVRTEAANTAAGTSSSTADLAAQLPMDTELLLFLREPDAADLYRTEGVYYYVTGREQGAYVRDTDSGTVQFVNTQSTPELPEVWQLDELKQVIRDHAHDN